MKHFRLLMLLAAWLLTSISCYAQDFRVGDFVFTIHNGNKVILKSCSASNVKLSIPSSVTYGDVTYTVDCIGSGAFSYSNSVILSPIIPNSIIKIGGGAFKGAIINGEVKLPAGLEYIGAGAFASKGITGKLVLPEGLEYLGKEAFANCNRITGEVVLPKSITSLGESVFNNCDSITSVRYLCSASGSLGALPLLENIYYNAKDNSCPFRSINPETINITIGKDVRKINLGDFSHGSFI